MTLHNTTHDNHRQDTINSPHKRTDDINSESFCISKEAINRVREENGMGEYV